MTVLSEYSMDCRYAVRSRVGLPSTELAGPPCLAVGRPKAEPSPTSFQSMSRGMGVQGVWLETRVSSAINGAWPGLRSVRWRGEKRYWSGIGAELNRGPRDPRPGWA